MSAAESWPLKHIWVLLLSFAAMLTYWFVWPAALHSFTMQVPHFVPVQSWLEHKGAYALLMALCFFPVLALSFDKRVHYYTYFKQLWQPVLIVGAFFIVWDVLKTTQGVWGFNPNYTLGWRLFQLPIEEWSFFVIVPFCCVFIHQCLAYYAPKDYFKPIESIISWVLLLFFSIMAILFFNKSYTFSNFFACAAFQLWHIFSVPSRIRSRFYLTFLISLIPFLIVNGVLTGGFTTEPIVMYNPLMHQGLRIVSIPIEDAWYGYLLLMAIVTLFEYRLQKQG